MFVAKIKMFLLRSRTFSLRNFWTFQSLSRSTSAAAESVVNESKTVAPENEVEKINLDSEVVEESSNISDLVKKDRSEMLMNSNSFDEIPGPPFLKNLSFVWKNLPSSSGQAAFSVLLSLFHSLQIQTTDSKSHNLSYNRLFRKYGPVVKLEGPKGADIVLIYRPEHIAEVYNEEGKFPVRSTLDSVEKYRPHSKKSSTGLYNLCGADWEEVRKAVKEPLDRGGEKHFDSIEDVNNSLISRIRKIKNRQNETEDLRPEIFSWGLECLSHVVLNKPLGIFENEPSADSIRLLKAMKDATDSICKCENGLQIWRFVETFASKKLKRSCEVIDGILSRPIRQAQLQLTRKKEEGVLPKETENLSMIESMLLNECMTPEEVSTSLLDLLLVGVNTTTSALSFFLYNLAQNQRVQRLLLKEVKELLPQKNSKYPLEKLLSSKYLMACLKESLRLRMPMPTLTRVTPADVILSNYRIPKGTYVVMNAQLSCLREQNFEKAEKFTPERWLQSETVHPFAAVPFGQGRRSCVAQKLAEIQLASCIARLVRNYHVEYYYGDISSTNQVFSFPDRPLKLTFIDRCE